MCGRRASIVHDMPGMTLDYLTETVWLALGRSILLADTGGVHGEENERSPLIRSRMQKAVDKADLLLVMTDTRAGLQPGDADIVQYLRRRRPQVPRLLLVNKSEGLSTADACAEFYALGEEVLAVSAKRGAGLQAVRDKINELLFSQGVATGASEVADAVWSLAIIGRPNVGKSTLMNGLLGHERATVSPTPGTTRDNVRAVLSYAGGECLLIDTAGMRRRRAVADAEKLSVAAARTALNEANAVLLLFDMQQGVQRQDKRLAAMAAAAGCGVVLVGNKCDLLPKRGQAAALRRQAAEMQLGFVAHSFAVSALQSVQAAERCDNQTAGNNKTANQGRGKTISAMSNKTLSELLTAVAAAATATRRTFSTASLNRALRLSVADNPPPQSGGVRPKLRYIHQGGQAPPRLIVHGGGVARIGAAYQRYLAAALARHLSLSGAPLRLEFRAEENPYVR